MPVDWRELILNSSWAVTQKGEYGQEIDFGPPVSEEELRQFESTFGMTLPPEMRSFLIEVGGARAGGDDTFLVFDFPNLLAENHEVRDPSGTYRGFEGEPPEPVDSFCVISNLLSNGDYYAVCVSPVDSFRPGNVVHWDHETNERSLVSDDLEGYLTGDNPGIR